MGRCTDRYTDKYTDECTDPCAATPLILLAVSRDSVDMVEALLDAGADPDATDAYGEGALHRAARCASPATSA